MEGVGYRDRRGNSLTDSETQVAALVARGQTNDEIADAMHITLKSVEWNLAKVFRALNVRSRSELAVRLNRGSPGSARANHDETRRLDHFPQERG
jgi:DNA-binding NarL/FixJ family response regulator